MTLLNRAVSYFADLTHRSEACLDCYEDIQHFIDDEPLCESISLNICTACNKEIPDIYYNYEHQMCRCCYEISLGGEKRCSACARK
jgi:hypothetical protein